MILDQREQKRRLLLRLKGLESARPLIGPATVHFRLTDLCNLACQYCWEYGPNNPNKPSGKNHLPFDVIEKVIRDCKELQVDAINLAGIGDPTFHPHFYDILRYLEHSFMVTVYTNGTFPIERCREMLRADRIIINLGAADRESYRDLQGKDLFLKVIKNIRELARLRPQFNPHFRIEVVFVGTRVNAGNVLKTEDLVKRLGADLVEKKVFEPSAHNRHIMMADQEQKSEISGDWPSCYHGWFYTAIRLNGDVNVCAFTQRLTVGNVCTSSFKEIWESDEYSRLRTLALNGGEPFRNYHECMNCGAAKRNREIAAQMEMYHRVQKV